MTSRVLRGSATSGRGRGSRGSLISTQATCCQDAAHDRDGAGTFGESHKDVCGAGTSRARPGENGTPGGDGAPVVPAAPEDPEPDEGRSGMGNTDGKSLLPSTPQVTELLWLLRRTRSPTKAGRARVTRTADLGPSTSQATEKGTDLPARQSGKPARARELRQANLSMWHAFCRMKKFGRRGQRRANSHLRSGRVTHDAMERNAGWRPSAPCDCCAEVGILSLNAAMHIKAQIHKYT